MTREIEQRLLAEPIVRPDGITIRIMEERNSVVLNADGLCSGYDKEEIVRLGSGDFQTGLAVLGQAAFREESSDLKRVGSPRLLNEVLGDRL